MRAPMFVEGVRLFVVVLGTAAGLLGCPHASGPRPRASAGCSAACSATSPAASSAGSSTGRSARSSAGSTAARPPACSPGTLGAIVGAAARARARAAGRRCSCRRDSRCRIAGLAAWIFGWLGFRIVARQSEAVLEMLGLSTRPLVRAQAFDARDGLLVDTSVVMDGQLLAA